MDGRLYWITGLSGAGKTTIGNLLYGYMKDKYPNTVILDGDALRQAFGNDLGYTKEDRLKSAMRFARLSKLLTEQGIFVICCTISMFDEVREWNRQHIKQYEEIYLDVPMEVLVERNQKNLYRGVKLGLSQNVVGVDLEPELPKNPDVRLVNDGSKPPVEMLKILLESIVIG